MRFSCAQYPFLNVQITDPDVIHNAAGVPVVRARARYAKFNHGYFETDNIEVIEALLHHVGYNRDFYGPFSIDEVSTGLYKSKLSEHIRANELDKIVPNVDKIAQEGAKLAAVTAIKTTEGPRLSEPTAQPVVVLKASEIIARQTAEQKERLADGANSR